jgi:BirA family biotin operon repressor/biotin-[acetyl-CoA-carboxylase] ligase
MTPDAQILTALRSHPDGISGAELAEQLGISRAAIWARIEELRKLGYDVAASPHTGYRLLEVPDVLHADDLLSRLGKTRVIGRDVRVFQQTTSTNDVIEKLARDGVKEGTVVFAETQSKGRGRLGRRWYSAPGAGLWFSVLLRPRLRPLAATRITVAAATALTRAIHAETGLTPKIKWPNDILLRDRKVVGILTELSAELDTIKHVILGIGVNVNQTEFAPEIRKLATSLKAEAGYHVDRAELAAAILRELDADYTRACDDGFAELADEWEASCSTLGCEVTIQVGNRKLQGRAEALDPDGALLLRTEYGRLERIVGGDVSVEK